MTEFGKELDFIILNLCLLKIIWNRLFKSAIGISLQIPFSKDEIIDEIYKVLDKNSMYDDVHIRLIFSRGNKITPYQNPKANEGPINFVIIPEHKKTNPLTY